MPVHNSDIGSTLNQIANLLEIKGENRFRVRAYRDAARTIEGLSQNVNEMVQEGEDLSELPGIGRDLAGKIETITRTGTLPILKQLKKDIPAELGDLMRLEGLGPKRIKALYQELEIRNRADLEKAVASHKVRDLEGFGAKTEKQIQDELRRKDSVPARIILKQADEYVEPLIEHLQKTKGVKDIIVAGSYRRRRETVGDLDILVTCKKGAKVMERLVNYDDVERVISQGKTRSSVVLRSGVQVDLRVVPQVSYGAALHYFTGSKAHNIAVRKMGVKKDLKINEYGVFKGDERIAGRSEKEVYEQVNLPWIPPELRENHGEIEAAGANKLPDLIAEEDIRGDLHAHSKWTDGHHTIKTMAQAARERGYAYLAMTDHSKRVTVAGGLKPKELEKQIEEIDELNGQFKDFELLKGSEVDILEDGSLDLPDSLLQELDVVVASVHYKFNLSRKEQTRRVLRALDNRYLSILGHPTGRMLNQREPYELDMDQVLESAAGNGCFLEINAHPERLDLTDFHAKRAKDMGAKLVISTDAHRISDLAFMRYGVGQARRGWLEADDVINTRDLKQLKQLLKRKCTL